MLIKKFLNLKRQKKPTNTILYFHGIFSDGLSMPQLELVAKELNYDFISYTLPLHDNNKAYDKEHGLTTKMCLSIIEELVELVKTKKLIVAGHSAGANWAIRTMYLFNEKKQITNLILVSPINSNLKAVNTNKIKTLNNIVFRKGEKLKQTVHDFAESKKFFTKLSKMERLFYAKYLLSITDSKFLLMNDLVLEITNTPILIILGKKDIVIDPTDSYLLFRKINKKINFEIFENSSHNPHNDEPERFCTIVKSFLLK
ncbi:MAG: alpha/beta fold hydrolase [Mycoplasma sp.]